MIRLSVFLSGMKNSLLMIRIAIFLSVMKNWGSTDGILLLWSLMIGIFLSGMKNCLFSGSCRRKRIQILRTTKPLLRTELLEKKNTKGT